LIPLAEALRWLEARTDRLPPEEVKLHEAAGRILTADLEPLDAPPFAALDGHAVRAADAEGASDYTPLPVGGAAVVAGAALPEGTDAVLPLYLLGAGPVALGPVPPGHGVAHGDGLALPAGTSLRPPHLAVLARRGLEAVGVVRGPRVALAVAGPKSGPDALTPMLTALVHAEGGTLASGGADLCIHAGRSGPGPDDDGAAGLDAVFAHGILIRPGETSALGTVGGVPALLLPGDPLACAAAFALLAAPALRRMGGRPEPRPVSAALTRKIASGLGQLDAVRVRLEDGRATPLGPADSTMLSAGAGADGFVLVPEGSEGYPAGATVWVRPLP
jgi:molybdopterin molybdotransferase